MAEYTIGTFEQGGVIPVANIMIRFKIAGGDPINRYTGPDGLKTIEDGNERQTWLAQVVDPLFIPEGDNPAYKSDDEPEHMFLRAEE